MLELLWRDLLNVPKVGFVVRSVVLMAGTFVPSIERPLVSAHEILTSQNRMHLVPDDRLTEVQAMLLQERWIVAAVGVATPDVEAAARDQHACNVSEPCVEQSIELIIGDEVIRKRTILGANLL